MAKTNRTITAAFTLALLGVGAPALADNNKTPPGNPCAKGNGNPCTGNNGNEGAQGNSGKEKVRTDHKPAPLDISMPAVANRSAIIDQIGNGNRAEITQTAPAAFAMVGQSGDRNAATVTQSGTGIGYADLRQAGTDNSGTIIQSGTGQNALFAAQLGAGNTLSARQTATGAIHNGALMGQAGSDNRMSLTQEGGDNRAILGQLGDGNKMTAEQLGDGNRLVWTQIGNNLSDLGITQSGDTAMAITQTRMGK